MRQELPLDSIDKRLRKERSEQQRTNPVSAFMNVDAPALIAELRTVRADRERYRSYCEEWARKQESLRQAVAALRSALLSGEPYSDQLQKFVDKALERPA